MQPAVPCRDTSLAPTSTLQGEAMKIAIFSLKWRNWGSEKVSQLSQGPDGQWQASSTPPVLGFQLRGCHRGGAGHLCMPESRAQALLGLGCRKCPTPPRSPSQRQQVFWPWPAGTGSGQGQRPRNWVTRPVPPPQGPAINETMNQEQNKHKSSLKASGPSSVLCLFPTPNYNLEKTTFKEGRGKINHP